jgi:hypothetical protein
LSETLNFVQRREGEYKIENCKSIYELGFLFKLPWIIYINEEEMAAYVKMTKNKFVLYYNFDNQNNYECLQDYSEKSLKVCLAIGNHFVNEKLQYTKDKCMKELFLSNPVETMLNGEKLLCVSENGVTVYFRETREELNVREESESVAYSSSGYEIRKIEIEIKIYFHQQNDELPLHLVQELTKTEAGLKFLTEKKFLQHAE